MATFTSDRRSKIVTLDGVELDAVCDFLLGELDEAAYGDLALRRRLIVASARLFKDWSNDTPDPDAKFSIEVDGEIRWLTEAVLVPFADEYARPFLEQDRDEYCQNGVTAPQALEEHFDSQYAGYQAMVAALDAILEAAR